MALTNHIVPDSPTNNFATLNPLITKMVGYPRSDTISEGNLIVRQAASSYGAIGSTISIPKSGKWYAECNFKSVAGTGTNSAFGIGTVLSDNQYFYDTPWSGTGLIVKNTDGTSTLTDGVGVATAGDILSIYIDADSGTAQIKKNNVDVSTSYTMSSEGVDYYIVYRGWGHSGDGCIYNFGQDPTFAGSKSPSTTYTDAKGIGAFYYQPPTGALSLCTANLPEMTPDVAGDTPQDYFKAVIWTGQTNAGVYNNGNVTVGFQPDLVWIKGRTVAYNHLVFDSVRGVQQALHTNLTNVTSTYTDALSSFDTDGFTYGADGTGNQSNAFYVAWCWKAGGAPDLTSSPTKPFAKNGVQYETLSAANITAGTITPTAMSVNTDAGFSIVKYNGNSGGGDVPHGLSQKPDMLIVRPLTATSSWIVWHKGLEELNFDFLYLNETTSGSSISNYWGSTGITNTKFGLYAEGTGTGINYTYAGTSPYPHIAYCWHSVEGYSKFGSYTGNGTLDGPFVYCGFRPAFVIVKNTSSSGNGNSNWAIFDTARQPFNVSPANNRLEADTFNEEDGDGRTADGGNGIDFLSNGFKVRSGGWYEANYSAGSYIFMAFAEQPFKYANAR